MLSNKSPLGGLHEAELVINSGSESGEHTVDLRAEVLPTTEMVTFNTVPEGLSITVDGVQYSTPVSFGVGEISGAAREWCEGSIHTITAPLTGSLSDAGGTELNYRFCNWDSAAGNSITVAASRGSLTYTANYVVTDVVGPAPPPGAPPPPPSHIDPAQALAGTPEGPFLRLSDGSLSLPGITANGFQIEGELFLSFSKMDASLTSTSLAFPATGTPKWLELGSSNWLLDWDAGSQFILKSHPPSLSLLGIDAVPDGQFCLELNEATDTYRAVFTLRDDFRPLPKILEFKKGEVSLQHLAGTSFRLDMNGGLRVLDLPAVSGFTVPDWAIDRNFGVSFTSPNLNVSLGSLFSAAGLAAPADFFDTGIFEIDWGDIRIQNSPDWQLVVNGLNLRVFNRTVSTVSGTAGSDGRLRLSGTLPDAGTTTVRLLNGNSFSLAKRTSGPSSYNLDVRVFPRPRIRINLPRSSLRSTVTGFPSGGIPVPPIAFDTGGAFDTGKISIPSFNFDGVSVSDGGALNRNYIRLRRETDGDVLFDARAQLTFLPGCPKHRFSLSIKNTSVDASFRGRFCVLPEPISLDYNSSATCPFSGSAFGFTVYFGDSSCTGVKIGGVTLLGNPP
jgi:hypothetical protein